MEHHFYEMCIAFCVDVGQVETCITKGEIWVPGLIEN
jgi:hypothetical protein